MHDDDADPRHPLEHLGHPGALAQQVMVRRLSLQPAPQVGDFVDQPAVLERLVDQDLETDRIERLLNQVVSTQLHRLDGVFDGGEAGHHDDRDRQLLLPDLLDQIETADARQPQVGEHQRARVLDQPLQRGRAVGCNRDLPVGKGKKLRKLLADQLAVVHHEDASFHGAFIRVLAGGLILVEPSSIGRVSRCSDAVSSAVHARLSQCIVDYAHFLFCQAFWTLAAVSRRWCQNAIQEAISLEAGRFGKECSASGKIATRRSAARSSS